MTKKWSTPITDANGGMHSPVNYAKARKMLLEHPYSIGLLYHVVLTGSEDRKVYRKAVERLCKELRANGMPCRYKACYERDKFKRFHKHVFLLIEAKDAHPDTIIHFRKGHWFTEMTGKLGLSFKIAQPQDEMHQVGGKKVNYAYVPKKPGAKLDDCLCWISYLYKARSKEGVEGQLYTASTNRKPKIVSPIDAPASNKESIPLESGKVVAEEPGYLESPSKCTLLIDRSPIWRAEYSTSKGEAMTPAFKYVAGIYETAVDAGMNVAEIQAHLRENGIVRSLWQVRNDLNNVFGFTGFADAHTAPPRPDVAELDRIIDRTPERLLRPLTGLTSQHERTYAP